MNIKFKNIHFENFLSFDDATLNLNVPGYTLVQGVNNNPTDLATSNGSGKSSIFEAIVWALTGETIRGSKDIVNLNATNGALVDISFTIDDCEYRITRTKDYKPLGTTIKFYVNGADKSGKGVRDTQKLIEEYIPELTASLIGSVIILGQGLPQRFSSNTPSGRKDVLEKLSKSDFMIQDLKDRVSNRKQQLSATLRKNEDAALQLKTQIDLNTKQLEVQTAQLTNMESIEEIQKRVELHRTALEVSQSALNNMLEKRSVLSSDKDLALTQLAEIESVFNASLQEKIKPYEEKLASNKTVQAEITTTIKHLKNEIVTLKNIKDVCPTCGQKLPGVEKPSCEKQEAELHSKEETLLGYEQEFDSVNKEKQVLIHKLSVEHEHDVAELKDKVSSLNSEIHLVDGKIDTLNTDICQETNSLTKLNTTLDTYINSKTKMEESISSLKKDIETRTSELLYINNEHENIMSHIDVVTKMNTALTRDFRGYLLTSVIEFINRKSKEYSLDVFETDNIDFSLDGNNISISYSGKDYSNLSGGERQKVDLIVQFAIRDMLCKYLDFSSNILAVDELFDNLDSIGCEKILNLISSKLSDVETIYIITHHAEIPIPADNVITVIKDEQGISRISNVF